MFTESKLVTKPPQPYAAILLTLRQPEIAGVAPPLIADVIAWIEAKGGTITGAPFFNYVNFFPDGKMEMQVGMPTATQLPADGKISTGTLPGGTFASLTATAPYHELHDANMQLDQWAKSNGHVLDGTVEGDRFVGANRLEIYLSDPGEDPSGHPVTEVAFRLK
ncbi:GyrI-like domain-containing protein [Devosia sp. A449]